jgi:hypothetical protein
MAPVTTLSRERLLRRHAAVIAELRAAEPALMSELDAINEALKAFQSPDGPYSQIRTVLKAVQMHLASTGKWSTKREIADALAAGGFYRGETMSPYLVRDSVNYHVKKGNLVADGDLIGLPDWPVPKAKR